MGHQPLTRRHLIARTLGAGVASATAITLASCNDALPQVSPATVAPFAGNGDPPLIVDVPWLEAAQSRTGNQSLVLDLSPLRTYRRAHLPGAVHAWWQDTMELDQPQDIYGTLLDFDHGTQADRIDLLEDLGIGDDTEVIAYDDDRNRWAARMVWFLRFLGHDRASVLDGGLAAWHGHGRETHDGEIDPPDTEPPTVNPREGYYYGTTELQEQLARPETALVDIRTDDEARDTDNDRLPLGRIPGAIPIPWTSTLRDNVGRLKNPADLERLYRDHDVTPDRPIVVYARYGVEAAHGWWVLKLLNYPNVVVYDRGWAGWSTTSDLPIDPLT
ncbi:MAG: sulfurtransferase [Thermomicrobiales bacterium]